MTQNTIMIYDQCGLAPELPHNALADARGIRDEYLRLTRS